MPKRKKKSKDGTAERQKKDMAYIDGEDHYPREAEHHNNVLEKYNENIFKEKMLASFESLDSDLARPPKGQIEEKYKEWFVKHADSLYSKIGQITHSVPPFLLPKYIRDGGSEIKGIDAQRLVGRAFRLLSYQMEKEKNKKPMFIISNLEYGHLCLWLRKPEQEIKHLTNRKFKNVFTNKCRCLDGSRRGEVDLIVLHEDKGVIFVQIKAVDTTPYPPTAAGPSEEDKKQAIKKGIDQLHRDVQLFQEVMDPSDVGVTKVLALPRLKSQDIINFGVDKSTLADVTLLFKGNLFIHDEGKAESEQDLKSNIEKWWEKLPNKTMKPEFMKEFVGRYVGWFSKPRKVEEKTEVSHVSDMAMATCVTGHWFRRLALADSQREILEDDSDRVCLTGPTGSGKTMTLILKACKFIAKASNQVAVVDISTEEGSSALCRHICNSVRTPNPESSKGSSAGERIQYIWFQDKSSLPVPSSKGLMLIIPNVKHGERWKQFLTAVKESTAESLKNCRLWCSASVKESSSLKTDGFRVIEFEDILRIPPAVQSVIYHVEERRTRRKQYFSDAENKDKVVSNGPTALSIRHEKHGGVLSQCSECANELAGLLKCFLLTVSKSTQSSTSTSDFSPCSIVILACIPQEDKKSIEETTAKHAEQFLHNLKGSHFIKQMTGALSRSLHVVTKLDEQDFEEKRDTITVAWQHSFRGLERDVVVFLPHEVLPEKAPATAAAKTVSDRPDRPQSPLTRQMLKKIEESGPEERRSEPPKPSTSRGEPPTRSPEPVPSTSKKRSGDEIGAEDLPEAKKGRRQGTQAAASGTGTASEKGKTSRVGGESSRQQDPQVSSTYTLSEKETKASSSGQSVRESMASKFWRTEDIARYSDWNRKNLLQAASVCSAQLILVVP